jgi:hypothetical protein
MNSRLAVVVLDVLVIVNIEFQGLSILENHTQLTLSQLRTFCAMVKTH